MAPCACNDRVCKAARQKASPTVKGIMRQALVRILETTDACTACMTVEIGAGRPTIEVTANQ